MFDEQGSTGMYANILLSTDGSDAAKKGLEHGIALAKALNAKVTVITVAEPLQVDHYWSGASQEEVDHFDAACKERAGFRRSSSTAGRRRSTCGAPHRRFRRI
jgi:nucleotide-binding universal stress UspA family protein